MHFCCNGYLCSIRTRLTEFKYLEMLFTVLHSVNTLGKGINPIILTPPENK